MHILTELTGILGTEERKEFRAMLKASGRQNHRKDLRLFDMLVKENIARPADISSLYDESNRNAYHSLRKRLVKQIHKYVASKQLHESESIEEFIHLSKFAIEKDSPTLARHYLTIAENSCIKQNDWKQLDLVLLTRIKHVLFLEEPLDDLLIRWKKNKQRLSLSEKMMIAHSLIQQKLFQARQKGTMLDLNEITDLTLRQSKIGKEAWTQPGFMLIVAQMIRSAVISTRNYYHFEGYVKRMYSELKKHESMSSLNSEVKVHFLYMIAHVLYRNRKFAECEIHLQHLKLLLNDMPHLRFDVFRSRHMLLEAALLSYQGNNDQAIFQLKSALSQKRNNLSVSARLNMQLNLCVYYFQSENYRQAIKTLLTIQHSEKWLEKKMGKEWAFKKSLIEVIVQYESGHDDIASALIRSMEKRYSTFLQHPFYQRASIFIGFIKKLLADPESITTPSFNHELEAANIALPGDREDIQAITFFCWLKSKMTREKYYDVLMKMLHRTQKG